tara:strand:- start:121 stop:648 length:528 start_codon:yes stop_codon:yes gene_type:complete
MAIDKIQSESINLADNFAFTGTVTGAGGLVPMFSASGSADQTITHNTYVLAAFDTETFDNGGNYTNTSGNYKFTVPENAKYLINSRLTLDGNEANRIWYCDVKIYKNGSAVAGGLSNQETGYQRTCPITVNTILDLSTNDYIQIYGRCRSTASVDVAIRHNTGQSHFSIFKILGV